MTEATEKVVGLKPWCETRRGKRAVASLEKLPPAPTGGGMLVTLPVRQRIDRELDRALHPGVCVAGADGKLSLFQHVMPDYRSGPAECRAVVPYYDTCQFLPSLDIPTAVTGLASPLNKRGSRRQHGNVVTLADASLYKARLEQAIGEVEKLLPLACGIVSHMDRIQDAALILQNVRDDAAKLLGDDG